MKRRRGEAVTRGRGEVANPFSASPRPRFSPSVLWGRLRFLSNFKRLLDHVLRVRTDHDAKLTRFNDKLHLAIVKAEMFGSEHKIHASLLAGLECYALKSFQLLHRTCNARRDVANVNLDHLVARASTNIFNFGGDADCSVWPNLRRIQLHV